MLEPNYHQRPYHLETNPQWRSYNHSQRMPWWHCLGFNWPHAPSSGGNNSDTFSHTWDS
jgi:hypothetical protein